MRITYLLAIFLLPLIYFYLLSLENNSIKIFYWVWAGNNDNTPNIKSIKKFCDERNFCEIKAKHIHIATYNKKNEFISHINKNFWTKFEKTSESLVLTIRLEKLINVYDIGDIFNKHKNILEQSGLFVDGIEIDYDSPSNKISFYNNWLQKLSLLLENEKLEITGLRSWIDDNQFETKELLKNVENINFQLYQYDKNIFPTQNFFNFINDNKNVNLAIYCNDYEFFEKIIKYIHDKKYLSVGFFINNTCSNKSNF